MKISGQGFAALQREALEQVARDRAELKAGILAIDPTARFDEMSGHDYEDIYVAADKAEAVRAFIVDRIDRELGERQWTKDIREIVGTTEPKE